MAETAFDRTERGLGSADLSIPDIVARTKGNPQDIMKLVMSGQINVTQGLLAKRLSDSVVSERNAMAAQQPNVLQEQFPELAQATGGLGAMPQAAPPMPAQMGPQMGAPAPQGMPPAQGGIGGLDFAPAQMAGGGIVGYATGDTTGTYEARAARMFGADAFSPAKLDVPTALAGVRESLPMRTEAMDRLEAKLAEGVDPEKERKRAEMAGLLAGLASVKAGMTPTEALVSGFVGSGEQIQQSKKDLEAKEMELLKSQVELEQFRNTMTKDQFSLAMEIAKANMEGADAATTRRLNTLLSMYSSDVQRQISAAANAAAYTRHSETLALQRDQFNTRAKIDLLEALGGGGSGLDLGFGFNGSPGTATPQPVDRMAIARQLGLLPEGAGDTMTFDENGNLIP